MAVNRLPAAALALFAFVLGQTAARAGNVNYNFNAADGGWSVSSDSLTPPEQPWLWTPGPSVNEGGWQAWRGADATPSGSYLVSPMFVVDDVDGSYVRMDIRHRFDFGGTGTTPLLALGQVQYSINGGTWLGIRTADFLATSGKIPPDYASPPFPFIDQTLAPPTGTYAVDAWSGTTLDFATGSHQDSQFSLDFPPYAFGPGDLIRFRFLVSTQTPLSGTGAPVIDWEINKVQIDGVDISPVPEPGAVALAGIGAVGCLVIVGRRRGSRAMATLTRSTAAAILAAFAIAFTLAAAPARAGSTWDFELSNGGWTQSGSSPFIIPPGNRWTWTGTSSGTATITGGSSPHWRIVAQGMPPPYYSSHLLTSPVFSGLAGTVPAQSARISIAHEFFYATGTSGRPINLGQLQYRLNGAGPWIGLPLTAFTSGSSVLVDDSIFGPSPFKPATIGGPLQHVDQASYLAPTYLTPSGTAALPVVSGSAAAFLGVSPFWPADYYVPTQAFLDASTGLPSSGISSLELRFTNLNLAGNCTDEGWNIRFVQVDFETGIPPVPEPAAVALGATGLVSLVTAHALRRGRHHRPSRPSESP